MLGLQEWRDEGGNSQAEEDPMDDGEARDSPGGRRQRRAEGGNGGDDAAGPGKRAPTKRLAKRPKLTVQALMQPEGLPEVFQNFRKHFADGFGGKGREVRDLRRLIELYQRWQHRVFPHGSFDAFQHALEGLSSKGQMRAELRRMRQDLVARVNPEAAPDLGTLEEQWDAVAGAARGGAPAAPAAPPPQQQQPQQESGGEGGEIDDDELLALQAEDQWDAAMEAVPEAFGEAPAAGPPSQRAVPAPEPAPPAPLEDELEDEEVAPAARRPAATRRRALAGWSDDDDSDDGRPTAGPPARAAVPPPQQQRQQQRQQSEDASAPLAAPAGSGEYSDEDDELLQLMAEGSDGEAEAHDSEGGDQAQRQQVWAAAAAGAEAEKAVPDGSLVLYLGTEAQQESL